MNVEIEQLGFIVEISDTQVIFGKNEDGSIKYELRDSVVITSEFDSGFLYAYIKPKDCEIDWKTIMRQFHNFIFHRGRRQGAESKQILPQFMNESKSLSFLGTLWKGRYGIGYCELCDTAYIACPDCNNTSCNGGGCDKCNAEFSEFVKAKTGVRDYLSEEEIETYEKTLRLKRLIVRALENGDSKIDWKKMHEKRMLSQNDEMTFSTELNQAEYGDDVYEARLNDNGIIILDKFLKPTDLVLVNKQRGTEIRHELDLNELEKKNGVIMIYVPDRIVSLNASFFLGLFGETFLNKGEEWFKNNYNIVSIRPTIREDIKFGCSFTRQYLAENFGR